MKDEIVEQVVNKFYDRSRVGINKYQTTLEKNNNDDFLEHLQCELMDATLYIQKLKSLRIELTTLVRENSNDIELGEKIRKLVK